MTCNHRAQCLLPPLAILAVFTIVWFATAADRAVAQRPLSALPESTAAQSPRAAQKPERFPATIRVEQTCDGKPFSYTIESAVLRNGYMLYHLKYPSPIVTALPQNNTVPAEYYVPTGWRPGDPSRPAVIAMHILDGNMELVRMTCTMLATHGMPAILFKLPYYHERGPAAGPRVMEANPALLIEAVSQAMLDVRRTVDVLASRPEVDARRIGITGISLGGIVAATAAEKEPRLSRAMLVLAGGDLWHIINFAHETDGLRRMLEKLPKEHRDAIQRAVATVDPLTGAANLKARAAEGRVLMINAADDEVIPRECTVKLAQSLGLTDRVRWLDGQGHYTAMASLPNMLREMVEFFGQDLPPGVKPVDAARPTRTPAQTLLGLAQETVGFLLSEPGDGKCHFADLVGRARMPDGKQYDGRILLIRGYKHRFRLECKLPVIGEMAIGQGKYPWMLSSKKTLFEGVKGADAKRGDPMANVRPEFLSRVKMLSGILGGAMIAPEILDPYARCAAVRTPDGADAIDVTVRGSSEPEARLILQPDRRTPKRLDVHFDGVDAELTFRAWQINTVAHDAMFEPPAAQSKSQVESADVLRVFSALINFAMESAR